MLFGFVAHFICMAKVCFSVSRVVRDIYHPHYRAEPGSSPHTISRAAAISAVRFARREEEEGGRREGRREEHEERWPAAEAETVRRRRITGGCRQGGGTPGVHGSLQRHPRRSRLAANVITFPHLQDSSLHPYDPTLRKVLYGPCIPGISELPKYILIAK